MMMSIFSPRSSFTMELTLEPFKPTHAPTGSTLGSLDITAILLLDPASLAMALISTVPSRTSATSDSNRRFTRSGWVLETEMRGPLGVSFTSRIYTLTRSVGRKVSPLTCSLSFKMASTRPTFLPSMRCTIPVITSFSFI